MRGRHRHDLDRVQRIKKLVASGMTYKEAGLAVGLTRNAVAGIISRYRDMEIVDLSDINNMPLEERNEYLENQICKIKEITNDSSNA